MPFNPYVILGVDENATQNEIQEAYKKKRELYQQHVFDEGEEGAEAARKLEELNEAYNRAMENCHDSATVTGEGESTYEEVKRALRNKDAAAAQRELDKLTYRSAEWHYYQSAIYYLKNWLNDSKKQLEIAMQMDPSNQKYQNAYENIKKRMNGTNPYDKEGSQGVYNSQSTATQRTYSQTADATDGCCAACQTLWCLDCCCECMGGDLIRCC